MKNWWQSMTFVLLACVTLAVLWDLLFWGYPLGISVAAFAGTLTLVLLIRAPQLWRTTSGRIAALLALLSLVALAEETSTLAMLMIIVTVGTLVLVSQRAFNPLDKVSIWCARWLGFFASLWVRLLRDNVIVARWLLRHPRLGRRVVRVFTFLAWWVLPLIAGLIFAGLFALANPVIAQFFGHLQDFLNKVFDWLLQLSFLRMFMWGIVFLFAYGLLRYRHTGRTKHVAVPPVVQPPGAPAGGWLTGPEMIIRVLIVLNLVFAIENILDIAYLYLGRPLPEGMTYTSYAHRGAYTLIATALLAGGFTLAAFRQNGRAQHSKWCRWMVYAWIVQNIMLLISTVTRVWIYVVTGELTRLRTSTMIWCVLVAMGFVWIILRIRQHHSNAWLWRMNVLTTFGVLFVCAFINFDGMIADYNVRNCAEAGGRGVPLEISYLRHLGTTSLPAVQWLQEHDAKYTRDQRAEIENIAVDLKARLKRDLTGWRGWTYRRWRSASTVMRLEFAEK